MKKAKDVTKYDTIYIVSSFMYDFFKCRIEYHEATVTKISHEDNKGLFIEARDNNEPERIYSFITPKKVTGTSIFTTLGPSFAYFCEKGREDMTITICNHMLEAQRAQLVKRKNKFHSNQYRSNINYVKSFMNEHNIPERKC